MKTRTQICAMIRVLWHEYAGMRPSDVALGMMAFWLCIQGMSVLFGLIFLFFGVT